MMAWRKSLIALSALGCVLPLSGDGQPAPAPIWERLPSIPDPLGFAGSFAGVSGGTLLVAGGANFPDKAPWEGGTKVWHDRIFALERGAPAWQEIGRLPTVNGYGVSISVPEGMLIIGGGDARRNFTDVLRVTLVNGSAGIEFLPPLPIPLAMSAGALLGRTVYVAGGVDEPAAARAQSVFLRLDLDRTDAGWQRLESWPGPARMLATAATLDGSFYLIGGADLQAGPDGKPVRDWLRDAYAYTPGKGWRRLADLPRPAVAAPSPAASAPGRVFVLGGDDGSKLGVPPAEHPGFPRTVLAYDVRTNAWTEVDSLPFSLVTTSGVEWDGRYVIPGGEARPGVRSTEVWTGVPAR